MRWVPFALFGTIAAVVLAAMGWLWLQPLPTLDVTIANDIASRTAAHWPAPALQDYAPGPDFSVIDNAGRVVLERGVAPTDELDAVRNRFSALRLVARGEVVGQLFVADPAPAALRERMALMAALAAAGFAACAGVAFGVLVWADARILRPFDRLREFARLVAAGIFDSPLRMERYNAFGAFTEAFDLLREELQSAHRRESALRESRKTLVSQLGHDIRTPLASIATTADLLRLVTQEPQTDARLAVIVSKTEQIAALLDDLFQANHDELASLSFDIDYHTCDELLLLVSDADTHGLVQADELPGALVRYDPRRLLQVVDNILSNAMKYAGTAVRLTSRIEDDLLVVSLADSGPGLPPSELALVGAKGVRGSNSATVTGSGLGLYTARWIMERMDGTLEVRNGPQGGFVVLLSLAMAGGTAH